MGSGHCPSSFLGRNAERGQGFGAPTSPRPLPWSGGGRGNRRNGGAFGGPRAGSLPLKQLKNPLPGLIIPGVGDSVLVGLVCGREEELSLSLPALERPWPSLVLPP